MSAILGPNELFNMESLSVLLVRLSIDIFFVALVVKGVYAKFYRNHDYIFTYFLLNIGTFSVVFLLNKVPVELGFALGLFAVFGILRYRTEPIKIRELTYLFIVIGLALFNSLVNEKVSWAELIVVNTVLVMSAYLLERSPLSGRKQMLSIRYDRLDLLTPGKHDELKRDLEHRIGLPIDGFNIDYMDLLSDTARLSIFYRASKHSMSAIASNPSRETDAAH